MDADRYFMVRGRAAVAHVVTGPAWDDVPEEWVLACADAECDHDAEECWLYDPPERTESATDVMVRMVGDDRITRVSITDLIPLDEEQVCSCGQLGCMWA